MTSFDDRKDAYENKYAHDKEADFRVIARRNKLLGLWAADKMHLPEEERDAYAKAVMEADFEEPGDQDVLRKVQTDLEKAGMPMEERDIRRQMQELLVVAREQINNA